MTDVLDGVRDHYRATGLTEPLKTALMALGPEDQRLTAEQLGALDQFHTRGLAATAELANLTGISTDTSVLDVGSGESSARLATFDVVLNSGESHSLGANAGNDLSLNSRRDARGDRVGWFPLAGAATGDRAGQGLVCADARLRAAALAKCRRGDGAGLRAAFRELGTKSHGSRLDILTAVFEAAPINT
jgi:hypothetical protein